MGCKAVKRNKIKSLEFGQSLKWPLRYSTFHEDDKVKRKKVNERKSGIEAMKYRGRKGRKGSMYFTYFYQTQVQS